MFIPLFFFFLFISFSGCGKTAYKVSETQEITAAPGMYRVPPKIDLLMVQDDTGSMMDSYSSTSKSVKNFLLALSQSGWNFHFSSTPLTTFQSIQQVAGSSYDGNSDSWKAPFPGALRFDPDTLNPTVFRTIQNFTGFLNPSQLSSNLGGAEPGLETILQVLKNGIGNSRFLRSDAMQVILVVGNGNDTSHVNFCSFWGGYTVPCSRVGGAVCDLSHYVPGVSQTPQCDTQKSSLDDYKLQFKSVTNHLKFYAAVAASDSTQCLGGSSKIGYRYQEMAQAFGGASFDVCTVSIQNVLDNLAVTLQAERRSFLEHYLFISQDASPGTITVTRYLEGDRSRSVVIPQDPVNGWTYEGYVTNVDAVTTSGMDGALASLGKASGFAIHLRGTAVISGNDTSSVSYKPAGASDSVSE